MSTFSCPKLLSSGSCTRPNCPHNHNILACDICYIVFKDLSGYISHCSGRTHKNRVSGVIAPGLVFCPLCVRAFHPGHSWQQHKKSKAHIGLAATSNVPVDIEPETDIPHEIQRTHQFCPYCQIYIHHHKWAKHTEKKRHRRGEEYAAFKMAQGEAEKDQNDVAIQGDLDFRIVEPVTSGRGITKSIEIRTTAPLARITLVSVKLSAELGSSQKKYPSPFLAQIEGKNRQLSMLRPIIIKVTFQQEFVGRYQERIEVQFEDPVLEKQFGISRIARAIVGDPLMHDQLRPRAPYIPRVRAPREAETHVVKGIPPPSLNAIPYVSGLPIADIPQHLLSALAASSNVTRQNIESIRHAFLPTVLDVESHGRHFKTLLWIEEYKMMQDLERYDMPEATLKQYGPYYHLGVPGLAEKRPSVSIGDCILARKSDGNEGHWYEGHVHFVHQYEVGLCFHRTFRGWSPSQKYHVRFKLNRTPVRRQHQALDTAFTQPRILFPDASHLPMSTVPQPHLTLFNSLIANNPAQLQAIGSISGAPAGSLPFIIFGPPGTGKTVTVVEAIKQLLRKDPRIKVLACAPSNSAADLLALRLLDTVTKDELFRLYAPSRHKGQVPDELEPFTYYRDNLRSRPCFGVPPFSRMKSYRVIVSTCISAAILPGIGMARGHFSHIFIDEAGHATEPEVFVSVKTMADTLTNVILSGDPKQLGPIIRSGIACRLGLDVSYLERLMARPPYELGIGTGRSITKLVRNFRSHQDILKFPNERFYENDLKACAPSRIANAYLGSPYLPNKKFPVVFHSVSGKDDREASSPSFFNIDEILQVKAYVEKLKADRVFRTNDQDIGIIAPYHAQCLKIRNALRGVADEVKVGSVEEFQGQERTVIIISTVRSSKEFVSHDVRHTLGFVANPRRFNVSVTRAKSLLIIIGDPNVLGLDPLWKSFLNYVVHNQGWRGPEIPWDASEPNDTIEGYDREAQDTEHLDMNGFARHMEALALEAANEDLDAGIDRPWRELE
ncbi:RNA helicase [Macrolepiota fuliginosa MF-IS2]|uniref:RNA helicase n=1 Tax=Macrolepiota fuliginosa MF-IS2 TaxID=1400762 RepID=A0A9P5WZ21_9AGAR|nr:RNA helicase [Macrolepiota fuliginosa MF-IS2]